MPKVLMKLFGKWVYKKPVKYDKHDLEDYLSIIDKWLDFEEWLVLMCVNVRELVLCDANR